MMEEEFPPPEDIQESTDFLRSTRPSTLDEFIGQNEVIQNLEIYIEAARERNEPIDHTIFSGPPGLGKTTLARIVAHETEAEFHSTQGPSIEKAGDLAGVLTGLERGDVLFIDEIHRLPREVEEYLYSAMEDFEIDIIIDSGPHAKSVSIDLPAFTLIGATTRMGLLTDALRTRFGVREQLQFYPPRELQKIIERTARLLDVEIEPESAEIIAKRTRGTPRVANFFLRRIRDVAQVKSDNIITRETAREGLRMLGVDEHGLREMDRKILGTLLDHEGGPVGLKTLSASIGEEQRTIEEMHEPYLIRKGYIRKTPRGRKLTTKGYDVLGETPSESETKSPLFEGEEED